MKKSAAYFILFVFLIAGVRLPVFAQAKTEVLIKNATVMTAAKGKVALYGFRPTRGSGMNIWLRKRL